MLLEKEGVCSIDKTLLDKYNNQFERILKKYPYIDDSIWFEIGDAFEIELSNTNGGK